MKTAEIVAKISEKLKNAKTPELQKVYLTSLVRLYHQEGPWDGKFWGTRPDTSGPYYKKDKWAESQNIEKSLMEQSATLTPELKQYLSKELVRHGVKIKALTMVEDALKNPEWVKDQELLAKAMGKIATLDTGAIGTLEFETVKEQTLEALKAGKCNAKKGRAIFRSQGCIACHTDAAAAAPKGPGLFDIASRYSPGEMIDSILVPSAVVSQGFPTHQITLTNGDVVVGFVMQENAEAVVIRNMAAVTRVVALADIKERTKLDTVSSMTPGLMNNLKPEDFADLLAYFQSLAEGKKLR
jgi:putative heme-binding domain-containing protein